jgi:hypothetical protein
MRTAAAVTVAVVVLGCARTKQAPLAPAAEAVVPASVGVTFVAARQAIVNLGLPLQQADQATGFLETSYVDVATFRPEASQYSAAERAVRYRIVVKPNENAPGSRVAIYAVYIPFRTGMGDTRRNEKAIPRDHPGVVLARQMMDDIKKVTGGG